MQGTLLGGRYLIQNTIGEGGMACVYVASDTKLNRLVAIKVLHNHMLKNKGIRERFCNEAQAVSRVEHPNIIKIYDYSGTDSDQLWIVMELINGWNVTQYIERTGKTYLHPILSCFIIREVCKALEKAHNIGLVHRDIKPENIMLTQNGQLKLMDFGIAKDLGGNSMTQTGTFMGSPSYMSPEQIKGENVDHRSDLYSLSILFYEIVTGKLPFTGANTHDVVMRIMEGNYKKPNLLIPSLPMTINNMICQGIKKKAFERYQTVSEIASQLDAYLTSQNFAESHIELERYFKDPITYLQSLNTPKVSVVEQSTNIASEHNNIHFATTQKKPTVSPEVQNNYPIPTQTPIQQVASEKVKSAPQSILTHVSSNQKISNANPISNPGIVSKKKTQHSIHSNSPKEIVNRTQVSSGQRHKTINKRIAPPVQRGAYQQGYKIAVTRKKEGGILQHILSGILLGLILAITAWVGYKFYMEYQVPMNFNQVKNEPIKKNPTKEITPTQKRPIPVNKDIKPITTVEKVEVPIVKNPTVPKAEQVRIEKIEKTVKVEKIPPKKESQIEKENTPPTKTAIAPAPEPTKQTEKQPIATQGAFSISSTPAAVIYLNGKKFGTTNTNSSEQWLQVSAGEHLLELKRNQYENYSKNIHIKAGERLKLDAVILKKIVKNNKILKLNAPEIGYTIRIVDPTVGKQIDYFVMESLTKEVVLAEGAYQVIIEFNNQSRIENIDLNLLKGPVIFKIKKFAE